MAPTPCELCKTNRALVLRPKNHQKVCKSCFISAFELETHETIISHNLFKSGERIAIGASGGKDSTVLASVLCTLNERYKYGLDLILLSIDEGITGYRDDSLETVKRNAEQYQLPLKIVGYAELYGWTMDQVVAQVGKKGNCTYCGVFRRQALDRGAEMLKDIAGSVGQTGSVNHVVTGHNADDVAETVLMNLLRGDLPRLSRATSITTSSPSSPMKRSKPLKYAYEKEIVLYAHHKRLDYFSTECIYSPEAFRGSARALIKQLERIKPSTILDIVRSGEDMARLVPKEIVGNTGCSTSNQVVSTVSNDTEEEVGGCGSVNGRGSGGEMADMEQRLHEAENKTTHSNDLEVEITIKKTVPLASDENAPSVDKSNRTQAVKEPRKVARGKINARSEKRVTKQTLGQCEKCGYISSQSICKACALLEGLNKSRPRQQVEVGVDEEDVSSSLMRKMERIELTGSAG